MGQELTVNPVGGTGLGPTAQSRALVKVSRAPRQETHYLPRAAFLAQLIACNRKLPQTRERRRAEPEQAVAVYAPAFEPVEAGNMLSRWA
jgi:hypothetical protein